MTDTLHGPAPISACPACIATPSALDRAQAAANAIGARIMLSVPDAHCAVCITTIESDLEKMPGVKSARLNLTLRRVSVEGNAEVTPAAVIAKLESLGYPAFELDSGQLSMTETDRQGRDLLMRLGVAGFSMMNIMLLSVAVWSGATDATRDLFHLISAIIAVPTVAFSGQPFFRKAWAGVKAHRLDMDFPISLAILLATGMSLFETLNGGAHAYFDAAVMLTFFLLAGRYLDFRTRAVARSAAQELAALEVPRAIRLTGSDEETVSVADLVPGDLVLVRPGGRIPVDGVIVAGQSELDRSLLTGETLPVFAGAGLVVTAGAVNLTGPLTVRVTAAGKDSSLHRMADLVAVAENARNKYTTLAERAARLYSPSVHILAFGGFLVWMWLTGGDARHALNIAAATLIITCPCALGLAVPAVVTAASGRLFRQGLLIKDGSALERLAEVDTVVFDKTGTLTMGTPEPVSLDDIPDQDLAIGAALGAASSHPLAQSLAQAARARGVIPVLLEDVAEVPGHGVQAHWNGMRVRLGRANWVGAEPLEVTAAYLAIGNRAPRAIAFADRLRDGAAEAVTALKAQGRRVVLISGDVPGAVRDLALRLGIDDWQAEALPQDKSDAIAAMQAQGHKVLMVGDGLNDTVALTTADVSISPASALDAARVASDIVLLGQSLAPIPVAHRIATRAVRRIRENFAISFGYNIIAVPIALVGLASPLIAALAMSASSITVALNALRLR
ncbi:MAG: cadmium-translocating P-type ATPase [Rhodobacter sp.]|uniref:heavy metal translocating P-type ATPase n=1 Tax=Pararhodobacter sp. TaxID=2127056 RepID=UPI001D2ABE30|nr:heavy metal translocating P-type ATPase [Pararhodobacter sp.]MCB1346499.1 cadmium-translocating P-type ATPase [Paracoccaceae bacterium]MCC0072928.1 cadmium-translocating P-type ATPase [Rhodobacter sp.]HPD92394.1 heavy metal translocating P-type ATPase [Pararhodobacter sp.]